MIDLTTETITSAAEAAVEAFCADPPSAEVVFPRSRIYKAGGLKPPAESEPLAVHDAWRLAAMQFIELWRKKTAARLGRYPDTVPGEGFRLLTPAQTVDVGEKTGYELAARGYTKGARITEYAGPWGLDEETRAKKAAVIMHQRSQAAAARRAGAVARQESPEAEPFASGTYGVSTNQFSK